MIINLQEHIFKQHYLLFEIHAQHILMYCLKACLVYLNFPYFASIMLEQNHFLQGV